MKKAILFDLDGTLVDTVEDIRCAINHCMKLTYNREITRDECMSVVGRGLKNALKGALAYSSARYPDDELDILYHELISYYSIHPCDYSKPYNGITELLKTMSQKGYALGILSNKSDILVKEIVKKLFSDINFAFVQGFCDKIPLKPNRAGVESFSSLVDIPLENIFYVGDSEVDGETVINSQPVKGILVSWGFRPRSVLEKFEGKNIKIVNTVEELKNGIN
ncbi:HAD family hydrolase [Bullifex porci]|uniref:HAD family hydrolase n=1 Tax=Bullifex porci TaxID=2606638 RepID=UPI0023F358DD|nr:HAD family hydrolase [Bullifex porci]MDD7256406.1 HAD family hydrolase [Bullifex porci]MDY2741265.1 HAD family hydrolase [Bullifex porci]